MRFAHAMLAMTQPRHERRTGGAHSATGRAIYTPAPPLPPLVSWGWTLIVALFGALLRIIRLGEPRAVVFDETYYVKDAWTTLNTGEPRNWPESVTYGGKSVSPNIPFADGDVNGWFDTAEYVVHPPMGKWFIAWGLNLFGGAQHVYAWRIATAVAGVAAIVILIRLALRLFHTMPIALGAGFLMAIDGVGIVMSRTGLLDNFIMVLALGAFMLLVMHRDWARARLLAAAGAEEATAKPPQIAFSWYRVGAAVLLGLTTGVKWSGTYFFAVFCVISVLWDAWQYHEAGYARWFLNAGLGTGLLTALYMVPIYALSYLATWIGWFIHPDSYMHDWALQHPGEGVTWLPATLRSFVEYHREMWQFHTTLDAPHDYKANPLTWPLQIRPTSFYWEKLDGHPGMCSLAPHSQCVSAVTSLGNPIIWWLGSLCAVVAVGVALWRHGDWRIWAVLAGFLAGWLPWAQYLHRTTFTFYSIVLLPWIILSICYVLDWIRDTCATRIWTSTFAAVLVVCTLVSVFFYPIWTALPTPYEFWLSHMWLDSWI
ncbi:dolichyl-phosphate-mannose--protein mannosyltransferase [uncultured Bifidobacterium sp.]|uniref:dolichyl-phosphate-mannose--protein mannosyltransferase n=1 Tax=uncultured Bifidobacterium sp. TaxID=165187 RepID=UPI0025829C32|nr:glycosyltransferase family 39 protein [uncultured Bifidobacterium sp.]MEE0653924.1 glycosyltransferase family 39 protein [Bifidobacterium criceti]